MSIASAITAAQGKVADCYTAISNKGGTLPATQNLSNMPTAIGSITTLNGTTLSVTPTTSAQSLTPSSPYNGYTSVLVSAVTASIDANITAGNIKKDVQILGVTGTYEGGGGTKYGASIDCVLGNVDANGVLQYPTGSGDLVFNGVEDICYFGLYYKFYENKGITSVSFPDLKTVSQSNSMSNCFHNATEILSVSFSQLETVSGNNSLADCFSGDTKITSVDLSKLKTVSGSQALQYIFNGCKITAQNLDLSSLETVSGNSAFTMSFNQNYFTNVDLSSLTTVSGSSAFNSCFYYNYDTYGGALETVDLSSLKEITGSSAFSSCFSNCMKLGQVSFNSLDTISASSIFNGCFGTCRRLTSISFPSLTTSSFGTPVNQFQNMFNSNTASISGTCRVHFPSNLQSKVSSLTGYPTFGGNASRIVIAFDLPATS